MPFISSTSLHPRLAVGFIFCSTFPRDPGASSPPDSSSTVLMDARPVVQAQSRAAHLAAWLHYAASVKTDSAAIDLFHVCFFLRAMKQEKACRCLFIVRLWNVPWFPSASLPHPSRDSRGWSLDRTRPAREEQFLGKRLEPGGHTPEAHAAGAEPFIRT